MREPNRWGCIPVEDVCMLHHLPLECKHGCYRSTLHACREMADPEWKPAVPFDQRIQEEPK